MHNRKEEKKLFLEGLNRVLRVSVIQKVKLHTVHTYINISKDSSLTELLIRCKLFTYVAWCIPETQLLLF